MFLNGQAITSPGPRGERIVDASFLVLINASPEPRKWSDQRPVGRSLAPHPRHHQRPARRGRRGGGRRGRAGRPVDPGPAPARGRRGRLTRTLPAVVTTPLATYRLQLHPGFGFDAAAAVAGYLADLGVTHAYLSPVLQAAPGSTHGYDVVDPSRPSDGPRRRRGPRPPGGRAAGGGAGAGPRHRAQPHGHHRAREPLVVGRARARSVVALGRALRRHVGPARGEAAQHRAVADPR